MLDAEREYLSARLAVRAQGYREREGLAPNATVIVKIPWWYATVLSEVSIPNVQVEFDIFDRSASPERWRI